ncbi:hypothetical protein DRW41_00375 [Neobacillus piezotolerans]|uniref:HipA-like kinase domain-containing protein n=1 Tax=Neobacillus piezotolerans TaxID=2259171 RepID=A0A3D8GUH8_9BACI|nr:HipA family kinase [Neobacillus piezotolerans]RDU38067.1 hypothetical protein DRW41_00375 [Neobacillus piezotolerans]
MTKEVKIGVNVNLKPVELVESIKKGYSKPQCIRFSDGHKYVVKFKNNPSGTRILVNEYIAAKFGQLLSLPVVPFEVVQISDAFIKDYPILSKHKFTSGSQFASLFIDNCIHLDMRSRNENIIVSNRKHLAGTIVFDLWIGNTDRKENNFLLEPVRNGEYYLHLIDHGRCFSDEDWTVKSLIKMPDMNIKQNVHKWLASLLPNQNELLKAIEKVVNISEKAIYNIINSIPDDWDVLDKEREALVTHLVSGQKLLPQLRLPSIKK